MGDTPPPRVRVVHPRMGAPRRSAPAPVVREINEQTQLGEVYMRALIRSQLRLAILTCVALAILLGGAAFLLALEPRLVHVQALSIPVPWLMLGVLAYPPLILLAMFTMHHAERNENDFAAFVRHR
jgi:O-antigen/teichoic acid export membrane protein